MIDCNNKQSDSLPTEDYELEDLNVRTTIEWPDGSSSTRIVNWSDRDAVRGFARVARAALVHGGTVITVREEGK